MKLVLLDADSIGRDMDFSDFNEFGDVTVYPSTPEDKIAERVQDADIIVVNKQEVREATIGQAKNLKLVCVTATGINNLDVDYLDAKGIAWRNVAGYSTDSVAQHTFALALALLEHLPYYDEYVKSGKYVNDTSFTHFTNTFHELSGMTWGVIGLGNIGRKVSDIARCFGAKAIYYSTSGSHDHEGYERVSLETLLKESDIVSVHAPLNEDTMNLMGKEQFAMMKKSAIFINVGRGPIVVEQDLADALNNGVIAAAGVDVLCKEPMSENNPLISVTDSNKLIITPHIAWGAKEARERVIQIVQDHIRKFLAASEEVK